MLSLPAFPRYFPFSSLWHILRDFWFYQEFLQSWWEFSFICPRYLDISKVSPAFQQRLTEGCNGCPRSDAHKLQIQCALHLRHLWQPFLISGSLFGLRKFPLSIFQTPGYSGLDQLITPTDESSSLQRLKCRGCHTDKMKELNSVYLI